jgi:MFS family permease
MPIPVTTEYRTQVRTRGLFFSNYVALLLLSLHWACVLYINSPYLDQFVTPKTTGILYSVSAFLTIGAFLFAPYILNRVGNIRLLLACSVLEFGALIGMGLASSTWVALTFFVIHQAIVPILLFNLDIIMETLNDGHEDSTGRQRGILLTIMSLTTACAPLAIGYGIGKGTPDFMFAYMSSAFILIPFVYVILKKFKNFADPNYAHLRLKEAFHEFWHQRDIRFVFCAHFLLQLFFTWMVIYTPLYLSKTIGFDWEEIGAILFVGLMAYVLLEYLIGVVADRYIGEKEMMAFGFGVMAIATSWFVFLDHSSILAWMIAMFMTRVGASFVETTTESYFFKHTEGKDSNLIGLFRITRPLSYVIGALLGVVTIGIISDEKLLFVVLGVLMIPGLFFAMALKDTK